MRFRRCDVRHGHLFVKWLLFGKRDCSGTTSKCTRLKQSFGQDMIYAVSNGKIKTPKSMFFFQAVKKLGHGVSFSVLQELATENAYRTSNQQESGVILQDGAKQETFTI